MLFRSDEVNKLLDRIGAFLNMYDKLGDAIESLQVDFGEARKKLYDGKQSVVKAAEKLVAMGGKSEKLKIEN